MLRVLSVTSLKCQWVRMPSLTQNAFPLASLVHLSMPPMSQATTYHLHCYSALFAVLSHPSNSGVLEHSPVLETFPFLNHLRARNTGDCPSEAPPQLPHHSTSTLKSLSLIPISTAAPQRKRGSGFLTYYLAISSSEDAAIFLTNVPATP